MLWRKLKLRLRRLWGRTHTTSRSRARVPATLVDLVEEYHTRMDAMSWAITKNSPAYPAQRAVVLDRYEREIRADITRKATAIGIPVRTLNHEIFVRDTLSRKHHQLRETHESNYPVPVHPAWRR